MKKIIGITFLIITAMGLASFLSNKLAGLNQKEVSGSIYDFKLKSLDGKEIDFAQYKGKNLLIK